MCGQARARVARRLRDVRRSLWTGILEVGGRRDDLQRTLELVSGRQTGDSGHAYPGTERDVGGTVSTHKMGKEDHSAAAHNGKWGRLAG